MAITCSDIIARAFRMAKIIGVGTEAESVEADEGMIVLRSIYTRLVHSQVKNELYEAADYEAEEGDRVYCEGTVTLPTLVTDLLDGAERRPRDLAAIEYNEAGAGWQSWLSDRGDWMRVDDLEEGDTAPLAERDRDGLSALVAMELADTFTTDLPRETRVKAMQFKRQLTPRNNNPLEYY